MKSTETCSPDTHSSSPPSPSRLGGKRRIKRHHHKTRDGCFTCRRRRVKCDERKPCCLRCLDRNEQCLYDRSPPNLGLEISQYRPTFLQCTGNQLDSSPFDFFVENTVEMLSLFPTSPLTLTSLNPFDDYHAKFAHFWKFLVIPMACTEPYIMQLVSILARRHRLALTASHDGVADHLQILSVMSELVKNGPLDTVIVGAMIIFAYECLHSVMLRDDGGSPTQSSIHSDAFMKLLPQSSKMMKESVMPVAQITFILMGYCALTKNQGGQPMQVPDHFATSAEAQTSFASILKGANLRPALDKWMRVTLKLYGQVRGRDWEESKVLLTMLTEAQLLITAFDLSLSQRNRNTWQSTLSRSDMSGLA